ncbi:twin-arginine translocase TatA/TatE family subunit [Pseudolysinimonas kribbensis]|uniref:Translocase n=2 Tax=Pseudolysinimonas kribbensis TaxID=433641 RepID=A0ABQ6K6M5_9MICO|nr:translocase [Pseudolysinimonas kribbensis]
MGMSFGLTPDKLIIIALIAVFLIGPTRLPTYAGKLANLVRQVRSYADNAKDRMREEMGEDFDEVDWRKLDPRQYDPRRIIREALTDDGTSDAVAETIAAAKAVTSPLDAEEVAETPAKERRRRTADKALPAPYDIEAT